MKLEVIILAAGQGTRMKSPLPKVLHPVAGRPMVEHVVNTASSLAASRIHVVIGHGAETVKQELSHLDINWVSQEQQLGTGHAVLQALPAVDDDSTVLVLYGDVPLTSEATLRELVALAEGGPALLTAVLPDADGYGRIVRDDNGALCAVVEHKDASDEQRQIREINTGLMAAPARDFKNYLPHVGNDNQQGEYYLPDVLSMAVAEGRTVATCEAVSSMEILGVNDRVQLNQVEREYQRRRAQDLMRQGVGIADANRLDIRGELVCGDDVFIDVNVVFEGRVVLGNGVRIGANCVLKDVTIGPGSDIHPMSHLQEAEVARDCNVGPYARLRPGTRLADGARVGNFVETKKASIGAGSKVNHLSYIGDCEMGDGVNIGAGTITCNYDGANKHRTDIGDGAFVGSNSTLVAPVTVGDNSFVAAGSTVTKRVGKEELAVGRTRQRNITGWQPPTKGTDKD